MEKSKEIRQIVAHLGFLPTIVSQSSEDAIAKLKERENRRVESRVMRLSNLDSLSGVFEFTPIIFDESQQGVKISLNKENGILSDVDEEQLKSALSGESYLQQFLNPTPVEEFALLLTNGKLVDNKLAIILVRAVLMSSITLSALTARLMQDPWPALVILFFTEIQEGLYSKKDAVSTFQPYWSVEEAYKWITTPQGKDTITAYEHKFGPEGVKKLSNLLKNLPLPGGLDKSDVRATSYSDPVAKRDLLGFSNYVLGFKRTILHRETTTPLSIAVIGEWGKGKSSFMRFLRDELESHVLPDETATSKGEAERARSPLVPRVVTVWFDAWQYDSEEKVLAALLQTVAQEIQAHFTPYSWLKYRIVLGVKQVLSNWRVAYQLLIHAVIVPLVIMLSTFLVITVGPELAWGDWKLGTALIELINNVVTLQSSGGVGLLLSILYVCWRILRRIRLPLGLDLNKLYEEKDHAERLGFLSVFKEEFQSRIEQLQFMPTWSLRSLPNPNDDLAVHWSKSLLEPIRLSLKDMGRDLTAFALRMMRLFRKKEAERSPNRIVVFIDDLDRCQPNKIVDILEAIKVTLDTPGIVFVLGMDDNYVKSGIFLRYKDHIETTEGLYGMPIAGNRKEIIDDKIAEDSITDMCRRPDWWPTRYLEKVIQISFRIPDASKDELRNLVTDLLKIEKAETREADRFPASQKEISKEEIKQIEKKQRRIYHEQLLAELDTPQVNQLILDAAEKIAPEHHGNPRRIKAFVNRCRLGLYLLKMQMPDMIEDDYTQAIEYFGRWEQNQARSEEVKYEPLAATHDLWYGYLKEIQRCLFGLSHNHMVKKQE